MSENAPKEQLVALVIRPQDKNWIMGEDWEIVVSYFMTLLDLKIYIEEHRGISRHRMQIRLKGKVLVPNRENWTIRRTGIYDGYIICVEPTLSGSWLWNPMSYYEEMLLTTVLDIIEQTTNKRIQITELSLKVSCPPCIKTSLRVFLRKFPERIHTHVDTTNNLVWLSATKSSTQLPTFDPQPIELGSIQYYSPEEFDWESYKDIDDMLKLETFEPTGGMLSDLEVSEVVEEGGGVDGEVKEGEDVNEGETANQVNDTENLQAEDDTIEVLDGEAQPVTSLEPDGTTTVAAVDTESVVPNNTDHTTKITGDRPYYDVSDDDEEEEEEEEE